MKFQIGKYYQSGSGRVICIIGEAHTFFHGSCLLAEEETGDLIPVGADEVSAQGWHQVSGWPRSCYANNGIPDPVERIRESVANEPDLGEWLGPVGVAGIEAAASPPEKLRDAIQKSIETAAAERLAKSLIPYDLPLSPP